MNRQDLADELSDILGLPRDRRQGKAYEIVNAIIRTISKALFEGHKVKVDGFGTFEIRERPPTRHSACFYHVFTKERQQIVDFPAKRKVFFKPSRTISRVLNHDH